MLLHNLQQPTAAIVPNQVVTKQPTDRVEMNVPVSEPVIAKQYQKWKTQFT